MLSLGQYTTVLLMLRELKQYDKAALFLQTCLKNKLLEKTKETGNPAEEIRWVFDDNSKIIFAYFFIKTYVVGAH